MKTITTILLLILNLNLFAQEREYSFWVDCSRLDDTTYVKLINRRQDKIDAVLSSLENQNNIIEATGFGDTKKEALDEAMSFLAMQIRTRVETVSTSTRTEYSNDVKITTEVSSDITIPENALEITSLPGGKFKYQYYVLVNVSRYFKNIEEQALELKRLHDTYAEEHFYLPDGTMDPKWTESWMLLKIGYWSKIKQLYSNDLSLALDTVYAKKKIYDADMILDSTIKEYHILYHKEPKPSIVTPHGETVIL